MISSGGEPRRNTAGWHGDPWAALTEEEREFLAPFRAAWYDDDDMWREPGVRLEEPDRAEDEYNGFDEDNRDLWWTGEDFVIRDEESDIYYAGGILPSERFYARRL